MTTPSYKILLADDNPVNLDLAARLLTKRGHQVTTAEDGQKAVDLFLEQSFDVVLMDLELPNLSGIEATHQIRNHELETDKSQTHRMPIIAMTAHDNDEERSACRKAGMDGFITKPIDIKTISQTIHDIIQSVRS